MNRLGNPIQLALCLVLVANTWHANAHSLPDPDRVVTFELTEPNVEKLASQIEAVLRGQGFSKVSSMPRMTVDALQLPSAASVTVGIILSKFEEKAGTSLFAQITTCRAAITMRLRDGTDKSKGHTRLLAIQAMIASGLTDRSGVTVMVIEGLSDREDPCVAPVRSNTSLERTRER